MVAGLSSIGAQIASLFSTLFVQPNWRDFLDLALVSFIIYQIIRMFMHTRANSLLKGVGILLIATWLSDVLQLNIINWLLLQLLGSGMLLLVILFQPELRRGLEQIGRTGWFRRVFSSVSNDEKAVRAAIDEVVAALTKLSGRRVGALVVLEGETGLADVEETGTKIDAAISAALIENIFEPNTPLHDGAVIIRDMRVAAAACILQLSEDNSISRELGTRHRAAIGVTETTDAVSLIVSEETGIISADRGGRLTRRLDAKSLGALLAELWLPEDAAAGKARKKKAPGDGEGERQ